MARLTGLFDFQMKVEGKGADALVEIMEPGIESWTVVQRVRGEWANVWRRVCHKTGSNAEDGNAANGAVKAERHSRGNTRRS